MDVTQKYLLSLIKCAIGEEQAPIPPKNVDWIALWKEAKIGKVLSVILKCIKTLPKEYQPDEKLLETANQESIFLAMKKMNEYKGLQELLDEAENRNIQLIVFKGPVLAAVYPEYLLRSSTDFDLLVSKEEKEDTQQLLLELGFVAKETKEAVTTFVKEQGPTIELHTRLWEDYTGEQVEYLESLELAAPEKTIDVEACEVMFTTLGYEEQLIYQIYHFVKHLSFQGVELRHFTDITLYINKYVKKINRINFWEHMKQLKYDVFCEKLFAICIQHFGMTEKIFLSENCIDKKETETLMEALFVSGMLGTKSKKTKVASAIVFQSYYQEEKEEHRKGKMWRVSLFPKRAELSYRYQYARDCKWLLPIAWLHRFFRYGFLWLTGKNRSIAEPMNEAKEKLKILEKFQLVESAKRKEKK